MTSQPCLPTSLMATGLLGGWILVGHAHQDPCHRRHSCPSGQGTYVRGGKGHCDECPDHQWRLSEKPHVAGSQVPASALLAPATSTTPTPSTVTVCFTPSGNYADIIVKALRGAKPTILVKAFWFTSAPIAKP
jgi:hypothetical protein